MRLYFTLVLVLWGFKPAWSQFTDRVWCFGDSAGLNFNTPGNLPTSRTRLKRWPCGMGRACLLQASMVESPDYQETHAENRRV